MAFKHIALVLACAGVLMNPERAPAGGVHEKGSAPLVISNGEKVKLAHYLVTGKATIFDFYSEYCPTCKALTPSLEKLHATHADVAVVMVNINRPGFKGIDWDSPVSKQYDLPSTPQFKVYGPDGKLMAEGPSAFELVKKWIN